PPPGAEINPGGLPGAGVPPLGGLDNGGQNTGPTAPQLTGKISSIAIVGNVHIVTAAIRAVMAQKVGSPYNAALADKDHDQIKAMGYFNGDVVLNAVPNATGGVDETYTVTENPVVKKIVFTANTPNGKPTIPEDKLRTLKPPYNIETQAGQVLNTSTLVRDLDKLFNHQTGYFRSQGYIADVSPDINIDPTNGTLTIPIIEAYIQSIEIKGAKKTRKVVVTREMRSQPGDVLNEKKLQQDLTRVYNLGLFDQVGPLDEEPTDVGKVAIIIPVNEKRSGQVSVGVGYSSRSKLVGRAELAENNFRGLGERVSLQWEVGGISSQSSVEVGFFEPYLDKHHTSLSVNAYNKVVYRFSSGNVFGGGTQTGNTDQYSEKRKGASLGLNRPVGEHASVGLSTRLESVTTNNVNVPLGDTFIRQDGNVAALGGTYSLNTRDQDFSPASGGLNTFSVEFGTANIKPVSIAGQPFFSQVSPGQRTFTKLGMDMRRYISLDGPRKPGDLRSAKKVVAVRLLLGFANSNIPFFEQYFLGGADSLRGYQTDRYWGSNLLLGQGELRLPFSKKSDNLQGVVFGDIGDAWNSIYQGQGLSQHKALSLRGDYGVGVRLVTPIGPIRIDYAIPTTGGGGGRTQFSIGQSF
nr:BamA/TamA family outer membrane protein [Armatimonadota bacterium]